MSITDDLNETATDAGVDLSPLLRESIAIVKQRDTAIASAHDATLRAQRLQEERDHYKARCERLEAALDEALEYFADREDVVDGDYGEPWPNKEMRLAQELRAAIEDSP